MCLNFTHTHARTPNEFPFPYTHFTHTHTPNPAGTTQQALFPSPHIAPYATQQAFSPVPLVAFSSIGDPAETFSPTPLHEHPANVPPFPPCRQCCSEMMCGIRHGKCFFFDIACRGERGIRASARQAGKESRSWIRASRTIGLCEGTRTP